MDARMMALSSILGLGLVGGAVVLSFLTSCSLLPACALRLFLFLLPATLALLVEPFILVLNALLASLSVAATTSTSKASVSAIVHHVGIKGAYVNSTLIFLVLPLPASNSE